MIIRPYKGIMPQADESCFLAENCVLTGDIIIGEHSSIWYNSVLRGDVAPIRIGKNSNIQDNCVLHGLDNGSVIIGDNVVVGHGAIVHGAVVEDCCLIGMGAIVLDKAEIGRGSIIAAGAVVPPRMKVPPFSLVMGVPGQVVKALDPGSEEERLKHAQEYALLAQEYIGDSRDNG